MHKSGVYGNFAAGQMWDDNAKVVFGPGAEDTYKFWSTEVGIQKKWNDLGKTTIFGQYYDYNGGAIRQTVHGTDAINPFNVNANIASSEVRSWGLGVMQKIDAAEMKLYALYRHYEFDVELISGNVVQDSRPLEDFQVLMTGAVINF